MKRNKTLQVVAALSVLMTSAACTMSQFDELKNVGKPPELQAPQNPVEKADYQPISWPQPAPLTGIHTSGSLWQAGSKTFFRDTRARTVGDIMTVIVKIQDKAELDNSTERTRDSSESLDIPSVYGLQRNIRGLLNEESEGDPLLDIGSQTNTKGEGKIGRQENIETKVAAVVTQLMANGNMAIYGSQEIRVNSEVRQMTVQGIVRPEDVASDNTVDITQLAEARISYGGKGDLTSVQRPRIGQQVVDILSPF